MKRRISLFDSDNKLIKRFETADLREETPKFTESFSRDQTLEALRYMMCTVRHLPLDVFRECAMYATYEHNKIKPPPYPHFLTEPAPRLPFRRILQRPCSRRKCTTAAVWLGQTCMLCDAKVALCRFHQPLGELVCSVLCVHCSSIPVPVPELRLNPAYLELEYY
jgi:hypothetical protein